MEKKKKQTNEGKKEAIHKENDVKNGWEKYHVKRKIPLCNSYARMEAAAAGAATTATTYKIAVLWFASSTLLASLSHCVCVFFARIKEINKFYFYFCG